MKHPQRTLVSLALALSGSCAWAQLSTPIATRPAWGTASSPTWGAPLPAAPAALPSAAPSQAAVAAPPGSAQVSRLSPRPGLPPSGAALAQANQATLAEARKAPAVDVPARPGLRKITTIDSPVAAGVCLQAFSVHAPKGQFTPGGLVYLRGCGLGAARGQLRLLGGFAGGRVDLEVQEWTDQLVIAQVPAGVSGVNDLDARLALVTRDGQQSAERPVRFLARRETRELPMTQVANVNCAHPQPSDCRVIRSDGADWAWAQHTGSDSQGGRDEWRLSFGSSFDLERIELKPGSAGGQVQVAAAARSGAQQLVWADWRSLYVMAPDTHSARYAMRFFVTGPVGLPVVADRP